MMSGINLKNDQIKDFRQAVYDYFKIDNQVKNLRQRSTKEYEDLESKYKMSNKVEDIFTF